MAPPVVEASIGRPWPQLLPKKLPQRVLLALSDRATYQPAESTREDRGEHLARRSMHLMQICVTPSSIAGVLCTRVMRYSSRNCRAHSDYALTLHWQPRRTKQHRKSYYGAPLTPCRSHPSSSSTGAQVRVTRTGSDGGRARVRPTNTTQYLPGGRGGGVVPSGPTHLRRPCKGTTRGMHSL